MHTRIQPYDPFLLQHATTPALIALLLLAAQAPLPKRHRIIPPRKLPAAKGARRDYRGRGPFSA